MHTPDDNLLNSADRGPLLAAYALDQLGDQERDQVARELAIDHQARQTVAELKRIAAAVRESHQGPAAPPLVALREAVVARLDELEAAESKVALAKPAERKWRRRLTWIAGGLGIGIAGCAAGLLVGVNASHRNWRIMSAERNVDLWGGMSLDHNFSKVRKSDAKKSKATGESTFPSEEIGANSASGSEGAYAVAPVVTGLEKVANPTDLPGPNYTQSAASTSTQPVAGGSPVPRLRQQLEQQRLLNKGYVNDPSVGGGRGPGPAARDQIGALQGELAKERAARRQVLAVLQSNLEGKRAELEVLEGKYNADLRVTGNAGEQYEAPPENQFFPVDKATALSTFSIDVDTASYANVRRFLTQNQLPPPAAVRIEELLNYFSYSYPQPKGDDPFSVNMELADCPWQPGHQLLRIGLKGKDVHVKERKPGNLVFLVDVSGSMQSENKLPLLKQALKMLVAELTENDRVTIVTYAGEAGLRLDATNGSQQAVIRAAIDSLSSGGSTNGSAGIELAYQKAAQNFIKGGTNRVILATDGDLNVGITSDEALVDLIKTKAAGGVFLTVLGVGDGNLKDAKMEKLADNGNGLYAYLDNLREARKVLVEQLSGSLETIAKDVKLQLEFNPAQVAAYRLIGYENRMLAERDFSDDKKDAGEIGAGHTVTALYELVPVRARGEAKPAEGEPLKYQRTPERKVSPEALTEAAASGEVLTLKLRYKQPDGDTSQLREYPLKSEGGRFNRASADFQFAAAVASFGMLLKGSQHRGDATISAVEEIAAGALGEDRSGYRAEFLDLVRKAKTLGR